MMYQHALLLSIGSVVANAAIYNYAGTSGASWSDPTTGYWSPTDELWMNTADISLTIPGDYTARIDKLIVGRHAMKSEVVINGGTLLVGHDDNNGGGDGVLFVGQYDDASGTVKLNSGSLVDVQGELAVAVSGAGTWIQQSDTAVTVSHRFVIGRYGGETKPEAIGRVELHGGTVTAGSFDMNEFSSLSLQGGVMKLRGDHQAKVQGHIDGGRIVGSGAVKLDYDGEEDVTSVWSSKVWNYGGSGE